MTEKQAITLNLEAELSNQLKDFTKALYNAPIIADCDVAYVQDMIKGGVCEGCAYTETSYTALRQAIIFYLLEQEQDMDLFEDLQHAVLETVKAVPAKKHQGVEGEVIQ
jgi:hypothetical protein